MKRRIIFCISLVVAGAFVLTGCGNSSSDQSAATGSLSATDRHNDQDVSFTQMMITHHRDAIDMANLAETRASSADVKALAKQIKATQEPEIAQLSGWLTDWSVTTTTGAGMSHHGSGVDHASEMSTLKTATGSSFDRAFLTLMTAHHEGAVEMAKTEVANGQYSPAKALAAAVIKSQSAEIDQMAKLLKNF